MSVHAVSTAYDMRAAAHLELDIADDAIVIDADLQLHDVAACGQSQRCRGSQ
jgi:hypothetical protein